MLIGKSFSVKVGINSESKPSFKSLVAYSTKFVSVGLTLPVFFAPEGFPLYPSSKSISSRGVSSQFSRRNPTTMSCLIPDKALEGLKPRVDSLVRTLPFLFNKDLWSRSACGEKMPSKSKLLRYRTGVVAPTRISIPQQMFLIEDWGFTTRYIFRR